MGLWRRGILSLRGPPHTMQVVPFYIIFRELNSLWKSSALKKKKLETVKEPRSSVTKTLSFVHN